MQMFGTGLTYPLVPYRIKEAIIDYVELRLRPGSFTYAVLSNNLISALGNADRGNYNIDVIREIACYCWMEVPSVAYGSADKVEAWLSDS